MKMNIEILEEGRNTRNPKIDQEASGFLPVVCKILPYSSDDE
jgi:hypothetical protein